jgi:hypothetical protein
MPIRYDRDDERRLITVTLTEPVSFAELLSVMDRKDAEKTWDYALLYDRRAMRTVSTVVEFEQIADHVRALGAGRQRGPVGVAIPQRPTEVRLTLANAELMVDKLTFEMLLTETQLEEWLDRNAPRRKDEGP